MVVVEVVVVVNGWDCKGAVRSQLGRPSLPKLLVDDPVHPYDVFNKPAAFCNALAFLPQLEASAPWAAEERFMEMFLTGRQL